MDKVIAEYGPEIIRNFNTDFYRKIRLDPRYHALQDKYGYTEIMYEDVEFEITWPPGMSAPSKPATP